MASRNGPSLPRSLGGQAVIEGVMIRGPKAMAVCVRKPDGEITCRTEYPSGGGPLRRVPLLRGLAALGETLTQGMRAMVWSAQVAAGRESEEVPENQVRTTAAISLGLATALFMLGPAVASRRIERSIKQPRLALLSEGLFRIGTMIGYLRTIGRMPQAQRIFAYHGAEHRAIQAYEAGEPLDVESLRHYPNEHVRCGTSFLLSTMLISSGVYAALGPQPFGRRLLSRVLLTPLIAGLSYESIRMASAAGPRSPLALLFRPNMLLQKLTTRDPDEQQMEVALAALRATLAAHEGG